MSVLWNQEDTLLSMVLKRLVYGQEKVFENQIYCFNISKTNTKWLYSAEVKSSMIK